jgi:predicted methyltransferase
MLRLCRTLLALAAVALPSAALPQGDINAPFRDPDYGEWQRRFESAGREVYDRRREIVAATRANPGMAVADVGAGTGLFTLLFAERLGEGGRVYAVDPARSFVLGTMMRAREQGHGNVVGVESSQADANLPERAVDLVFICDAYHHFERPAAMLASLRRALRPGGTLVLVDYERIPGVTPEWLVNHVRAGKEVFRREIESAGFRFVEEERLMRENYFLRFARD